MTCFLEYQPERPESVHVHDLIHTRDADGWALHKSSYYKLKLGASWMEAQLAGAGFRVSYCGPAGRLIGLVGVKDER